MSVCKNWQKINNIHIFVKFNSSLMQIFLYAQITINYYFNCLHHFLKFQHSGMYSGTQVRPRSNDTFFDSVVMSNSESSINDVSQIYSICKRFAQSVTNSNNPEQLSILKKQKSKLLSFYFNLKKYKEKKLKFEFLLTKLNLNLDHITYVISQSPKATALKRGQCSATKSNARSSKPEP